MSGTSVKDIVGGPNAKRGQLKTNSQFVVSLCKRGNAVEFFD